LHKLPISIKQKQYGSNVQL